MVQTASATQLVELVDSTTIQFGLKIASLVLMAQMSLQSSQMELVAVEKVATIMMMTTTAKMSQHSLLSS